MTWLQTYTGVAFDLLNPEPEMVRREDIAHALSQLCRYAGHTRAHYSVAEHCCHIHDYVLEATGDANEALWGLLHDAHEAYVADVPAPVKFAMPLRWREELGSLVDCIDYAILDQLGVHVLCESALAVKRADLRILLDERDALLGPPPQDWQVKGPPLGVTIHAWDAPTAKSEWLSRLERWRPARQAGGAP